MTELNEAFFERHGISMDVARERYVRFEKGDTSVARLVNAGFEQNVIRLAENVAGQSAGYAILRNHLPGTKPMPPQMRPDKAIYTIPEHVKSPSFHPWPVERLPSGRLLTKRHKRTNGKWTTVRALSESQVARHVFKYHGGKAAAIERGLDPDLVLTDPTLVVVRDEIIAACNLNGVHLQPPDAAKYVLPPGREWSERLDIPKTTLKNLLHAKVVFFGIEGSLKCDAMNSAGAVAFCVPSVTLWGAPELPRFVLASLRRKPVVIVPDADWCKKSEVMAQAMRLRTYLRSMGVDACIAAPPLVKEPHPLTGELRTVVEVDAAFRRRFGCDGELKGVDDYLAAGRDLYGLDVIQRETSDAAREWLSVHSRRYRKDRFGTLTKALERLPLHADESGQIRKCLSSFATIMECDRETARKAIATLVDEGAVILEAGDTCAASYQYEDHDYDWDNRPHIMFAPEFRAITQTVELSQWLGMPQNVRRTQISISGGMIHDQRTARKPGAGDVIVDLADAV